MRPESTALVEALLREFGPFPEPILDIGGAETDRQFGHLFKYMVCDIREVGSTEFVLDARTMWSSGKLGAGSVGTILCFDTLEHIYEFGQAVHQMAQVLFEQGLVVIGTPWSYRWHDPSGDYWRFSPQALQLLFGAYFEELDSGFYAGDEGAFYLGRKRRGRREPHQR